MQFFTLIPNLQSIQYNSQWFVQKKFFSEMTSFRLAHIADTATETVKSKAIPNFFQRFFTRIYNVFIPTT